MSSVVMRYIRGSFIHFTKLVWIPNILVSDPVDDPDSGRNMSMKGNK